MTTVSYSGDQATVYDLIYDARGKNYDVEADRLLRLIRDRKPDAGSLLDVGCGTGRHLQRLCEWFSPVEGVDLSEDMIRLAKTRLPEVPLHVDDMRTLDLGRRFDVVTCLFGVIAHVGSRDELRTAVARLAAHLNPGGVLAVEPWFTPDAFPVGSVDCFCGQIVAHHVVRMTHHSAEGRHSRLTMHHLIGDQAGIHSFSVEHDLMLFSHDEYDDAFRDAGCVVTQVHDWPVGRGLYVGVQEDNA